MLTIDAARDFIGRQFKTTVASESIAAAAALGRIVAGDIRANADLPRFNASAMDGYAVRAADLEGSGLTTLRIVGRSLAGHPAQLELGEGEAMRVLTGAVLPEGADRVLKQEDCVESNGWIAPTLPIAGRPHVRMKGEDVARGAVVIADGTRLGARHLALLGSLGIDLIRVCRPLRVALFSTGDEVSPGPVLGEGLIGDANRPMLRALLQEFGCIVSDGGIIPDDQDELTRILLAAAQDNDLMITSGGMSVGDEDHLTSVIRRRGYLEFWRLNVRPGKPAGFGDIDDCPVLGLPGNPIAAMVMFQMLGLPLIARLAGDKAEYPRLLKLPMAAALDKSAEWWEAIPARLRADAEGNTSVEAVEKRGSAMLSSLVAADGFIILPEGTGPAAIGDAVDFLPLTAS
jgi:molybdopterin molybdotransferase